MTSVRPVTVVVPTRNHADRLPKVAAQLRAQNYPQDAFEILVVDNGSTDQTQRILNELAAAPGPTVRFVLESRPGITHARNRGAQEAHFPFIAYCDDDCGVGPEWLGHLMQGFDLAPDIVAGGGLVVLEWGGKAPPWMSPGLEPYLAATTFLGTRSRVLDEGERLVEFNLALEKQVWEKAGGFQGMEQFGSRHPAAGEGLLLFKRIRGLGRKMAFASEAVMWHHVRARTSRCWMIRRGYWQGVSDTLMEGIANPGPISFRLAGLSLARCLTRLAQAAGHSLLGNTPSGMLHCTQAASYLGRTLAHLHFVGDWRKIASTSVVASYGICSRSGGLLTGGIEGVQVEQELVPGPAGTKYPSKVSVIIPTLNRSTYLRDLVESLLRQPALPAEIVIVDNCSTDDTRSVVQSLAQRAPVPVHYCFEARSGSNIARDHGAKVAQGGILAYLDDDSLVCDHWLEELLEAFASHLVQMVAGRVDLIFEATRPAWLTGKLESYLSSTARFGTAERLLRPDEYPVGANMAVRREAWVAAGGFGSLLDRRGKKLISNDEFDLAYKIRQSGGQILFAPRCRVLHRVPPDRLTLRWFMRRCYWQGRSDAIWQQAQLPSNLRRIDRNVTSAASNVVKGLLNAGLFFLLRRQGKAAERFCAAMSWLGYLSERLL